MKSAHTKNMKIPTIPKSMDEWNIEKLNELTKNVGIESEYFDFKKEPNELEEHICAMANTKGGYLVLGIEQIKSKDRKKTIRFEKRGFASGSEDGLKNRITSGVLLIEPIPDVEIEHIHEDNEEKFYTVIKIENRNSAKPYFVKSTNQCFIRINDSKIRANRSIIFNLFSFSLEQRKNIARLRSSSHLLKQELGRTIDFMESLDPRDLGNTPPVDLSFIRDAVITTESFLTENNFLNNESHDTFHFVFHTVELANTLITKFNTDTNTSIRTGIKEMLTGGSHIYKGNLNSVSTFLDKVIVCADEYLSRQQ